MTENYQEHEMRKDGVYILRYQCYRFWVMLAFWKNIYD